MSDTAADEKAEPSDEGAIGQLVEDLKTHADRGEQVSIGLIQRIAGQRAAGPVLLLPALVVVSPLSAIPGLPTLVGLNTILVAGQLVLGRDQLWLPQWLTKREVPAKYGDKLLKFLGRLGRAADRVVKPRASSVTGPIFRRLGAGICVAVACVMPVMELIPFTSTWAASVIAVYALAITARDGFLALAWCAFVVILLSLAWLIFG